MEKDNIYIGKIEKLADEGWGMVNSPQGIVNIHYAIPEEVVKYRIIEKTGDKLWGKILKIESVSPHRIDVECENYKICGGCNLMHIKYEHQLNLKKERFIKTLSSKLKQDIIINRIYMENPFNYRVKAKLKGIKETGKTGFIEKGKTKVMEIKNCLLFHRKLNDFLYKWNNLMSAPFVHQIDLFYNTFDKKTYAYLSHEPENRNFEKAFGKDTIFVYPSSKTKPVKIKIGEFFYRLYPHLFFQVNGFMWETLLKAVENILKKGDGKRDFAIDLFSGVGFFTPLIKKYYKDVVGVESSEIAVKLAKESFPDIKFIKTPVDKFSFPEADLIFVDPPRSGLGDNVLQKIIKPGYKKIIYLSCSYRSLADDLKILVENGYIIESTELLDMFPHTPHIESLTFLLKT